MEVNPNLSEKAQYDYALVLRATKESDQQAYAELMERYRDAIFHLCRRMVFNDDDADDLTIETFGKAFQKLKQYTPAFAFSTWLFKIASNHSIDFIRKKRIKALSLDKGFTTSDGDQMQITVEDESPDPFETLEKKQRVERILDECFMKCKHCIKDDCGCWKKICGNPSQLTNDFPKKKH